MPADPKPGDKFTTHTDPQDDPTYPLKFVGMLTSGSWALETMQGRLVKRDPADLMPYAEPITRGQVWQSEAGDSALVMGVVEALDGTHLVVFTAESEPVDLQVVPQEEFRSLFPELAKNPNPNP